MIFGIDKGHTLMGAGTGAIGVVKETDKNRQVGDRLIFMLKEKGHTVVDCTVDQSNNDLYDRVQKANKQRLDMILSIHLNCYDKESANGVETFSLATNGKGYECAKVMQNELVKNIGWTNRGVKQADFYMLRKTNAPAVLVELGFCSSPKDMRLWNTEKIAECLFKALTGVEYKNISTGNNSVSSNIQGKYIVTNYLPVTPDGLDLKYVLSFFGNVRCYLKHDNKGYWIETQYLDNQKLEELKISLGNWIYSIK